MKAGKEEITIREIGRNELAAIKVASAFVDAQRSTRQGTGTATASASTPGKSSAPPATRTASTGLDAAGQEASPLGLLLARAAAEGRIKQPGSYHGYRYRILTTQGPQVTGGRP